MFVAPFLVNVSRPMSLTPTAVPELQLDCRLLLFIEVEGGGGGGGWVRDSVAGFRSQVVCVRTDLRAKQAVPGSHRSALQHDSTINLRLPLHSGFFSHA